MGGWLIFGRLFEERKKENERRMQGSCGENFDDLGSAEALLG